jgi:hypothetical protein
MGGVGGVRVSKEGRAQVIDNQIVRNLSGGGLYLVDGFMVAKGNIIADNLKGVGIRIQQHFDHYKPSQIENNRIENNELGTILQPEREHHRPSLAGNTIKEGTPSTASETLNVASASFDARTGQTTLTLSGSAPKSGSLAGRTVWRGARWSVVSANTENSVTVWGDLSDSGDNSLHVLPDYPGI